MPEKLTPGEGYALYLEYFENEAKIREIEEEAREKIKLIQARNDEIERKRDESFEAALNPFRNGK